MNEIKLKGIIKHIEHSHNIQGVEFEKAQLLVQRPSGKEDTINIKFKSFSNAHKENDEVSLIGNIRSYSQKIDEHTNKVAVYVFTYFDKPEEELKGTNSGVIDGRICKINPLRTNKDGKHNVHFILANNIISEKNGKRLNSYIPCIAWGKVGKDIAKLPVSTKLKLTGELHSREHKKIHENSEVEFRVAHEFLVTNFEVLD